LTTRICLDLNVWCAAFLADRAGRQGTACQTLVEAVRSAQAGQEALQLVISWGMLERLKLVLVEQLRFDLAKAAALTDAIAGYAQMGPSLTLGGVGVIALQDTEDRHVLETAWAASAQILVTANLDDFVQGRDDTVRAGRTYRLKQAGRTLILTHPFEAAHWLREGIWRTAADQTGA
jgi:predicted nucleic acid-binding protein